MIAFLARWRHGLGAAAVLACVVAWLFGAGTPGMMNLPTPFSARQWKSASGNDDYERCSMVADLRHRVGLVGRPRSDVVRLLGEPDAEYDRTTSAYMLCPSFTDIYVLDVEWANGRVASTSVHDT